MAVRIESAYLDLNVKAGIDSAVVSFEIREIVFALFPLPRFFTHNYYFREYDCIKYASNIKTVLTGTKRYVVKFQDIRGLL